MRLRNWLREAEGGTCHLTVEHAFLYLSLSCPTLRYVIDEKLFVLVRTSMVCTSASDKTLKFIMSTHVLHKCVCGMQYSH